MVRDYLSVHKSARPQQTIAAVGARLVVLPASSPDVNPLERAVAKRKPGLRMAGAALSRLCWRRPLPRITATVAQDFSRHAGYEL